MARIWSQAAVDAFCFIAYRDWVVLGSAASAGAPKIDDEIRLGEEKPAPTMKEAQPSTAEELTSNDDDDTMSYFSKLINEDAA